MGRTDRIIRALMVAPLLILAGIVVGPGALLSYLLYALAAVMLGTSAVGFCPLYLPLGIRTTPRAPADA